MPYLGLLDTTGIQEYLFRFPQLKSIAASSRVIEAMSAQEAGFASEWSARLFDQTARKYGVHLVMAAGGNAAFRADIVDPLHHLFRELSRVLLEKGDGLGAVGWIEEYIEGEFAAAYRRALLQVETNKLTEPRSLRLVLPGLSTPGRVAASLDYEQRHGLTIPKQMDEMVCTSTENSDLIAVVSVDGIAMGKRLIEWLNLGIDENISDINFLVQLEALSKAMKMRWTNAWGACLNALRDVFVDFEGRLTLPHPIWPERKLILHSEGQRHFFPCRSIYQGGDDFSFVCDARIALSLTAFFLHAYENAPVDLTNVPSCFHRMTASAGIVFVDSHFPFMRAAGLAELVRQKAKKRAVEENDLLPPSTLNWWLNRQGALTPPEPSFPGATLKPYVLSGLRATTSSVDWQTLQDRILNGTPECPGLWRLYKDSRNKLKDLQQAAEEGMEGRAVKRLLHMRPLPSGSELTFLPVGYDPRTGFNAEGSRTLLLDACEIYDLHFPFPPYVEAGLYNHDIHLSSDC